MMDVDKDNQRHRREEEDRKRKRHEKRRNKSESQLEREKKRREHNQRVIANQGKGQHRPSSSSSSKHSRSHKSSRSSSSKSKSTPAPPPSNYSSASKFAQLFTKRSGGFLIDLHFRNAAPRPPVGPCFVGLGLEGELNGKWTKYKGNNAVEANYSWKLHAEPDLGVPLAPSAMDQDCYVDPLKAAKETSNKDAYDELFGDDDEQPNTKKADEKKGQAEKEELHPDDYDLIHWKGPMGDTAAAELQNRRDRARADARNRQAPGLSAPQPKKRSKEMKRKDGRMGAITSRVLINGFDGGIMRNTTYMENDLTRKVHDFKSMVQSQNEKKQKIEEMLGRDKISQEEKIEKSFAAANKENVVNINVNGGNSKPKVCMHPERKGVKAIAEIPLFPDTLTWGHTLAHIVLDNLPKTGANPKNKVTSKQLQSAYIGDVSKGAQKLRMECNLFVKTGDDNHDDDDDDDDGAPTYSAIQKYDLDINPLKEENAPHANFLLAVDEEKQVASYHPISSRVQLSTGRPASFNGYGAGAPRKILKRELAEEELEAFEKGLADVDFDMAKKYNLGNNDGDDDRMAGDKDDDSDQGDAESAPWRR